MKKWLYNPMLIASACVCLGFAAEEMPKSETAVSVEVEVAQTQEAQTPQGNEIIQTDEIVSVSETQAEDIVPAALADRHKRDKNGGYRHISSYERKAKAFEKKAKDQGTDISRHLPPAPKNVNLPYGNLGLNAAAAKVNDWQSDLYNKTGVSFFADYYGTYLTNPYGGERQGGNYTSMLTYGLSADLGKIGWKGATLTVSGAYNTGANLSNKIGNYMNASNTYVTNGALFYELYLSQQISIADDTLTIMLGRMAMSDVFASLPVFGNLVSGGMDCTPTAIYSNSPYQSGPIAAWGGVLQYETAQSLQFSVGAYQIPDSFGKPDYHGTDFGFHSDAGYMLMAQLQWSPVFNQQMKDGKPVANTGLPGVYQVGAYYARDLPASVEVSFGNQSRDNVYGFYAQGQQMVWRDPANLMRAISMWAGLQWAPLENVSLVPLMFYSGLQFQGFVPDRESDSFLLSWSYGSFSSAYNRWNVSQGNAGASYEQVLEFTYIFQLNDNVSIQPDLQYIMRPYGNANIDDAIVVGAQINVSF